MDEQKHYRAYICCGPNCSLHRSSALVDALQREVDQAGLSDEVEVMPGGCMKHCERGPSMVVWPGRVYYERVDVPRLRRIVREHLGAGRPARELFYVEPGLAEQERARARREQAMRALEDRLSRQRADEPQPQDSPQPTPRRDDRDNRQQRRGHRPSWRQSDGDVDDFKW